MQTCFTISLWLTKLLSIRLELFISLKLVVVLKMSSIFFQKQTYDSYRFISKLMDVYLMAGVHQQPDQSNYLAEGQTCKLVMLRCNEKKDGVGKAHMRTGKPIHATNAINACHQGLPCTRK